MFYHEYYGGFGGFRGWQGGPRARRGDMSPIILKVLSEKPMHGYEIISHLEEKTNGMWRPSPGSVYPTLQMLEEEELVESKQDSGKKVYSLTKKGKEAASSAEKEHKAHWQEKDEHARNFHELRLSFFETMSIMKRLAVQNSEQKNKQAQAILNEAKQKLEKLLDQD